MADINLLYCNISINRATLTKYPERLAEGRDWCYQQCFLPVIWTFIYLFILNSVTFLIYLQLCKKRGCQGWQCWSGLPALVRTEILQQLWQIFSIGTQRITVPWGEGPCPWLSSDSHHLNCSVTFVPTCKPRRAAASCNIFFTLHLSLLTNMDKVQLLKCSICLKWFFKMVMV